MDTNRIAIVCDSTSNIPPELVRQYGIHVAPLQIIWDNQVYRDGVDMTSREFYARLRRSRTLPTTSGAVQGEFLLIYESLRGKVDGVVTFTVSSDLSACYNSALNARQLVPDLPVEVVDTKLATLANGFAVLAAARAATAGADMRQVVEAARATASRVHLFFALETLEYLRRGGRVSLPAATLAGWLKVKPVLTIKDGKVEAVGKPRTRARAVQYLLELMEERVGAGPLHVGIMHGDVPEEAEGLRQEVESRFKCVELLTSEFTPVMGAHAGPGLLGVAFYNE